MRSGWILVLLCLATAARGQFKQFGEAHAIVGARIEIGDGRVIEIGTVVIRDGFIEAVGANVKVPPDADVLKGDGLILFPGFIDAWSTKGLKLPAWDPNQDVAPFFGDEASPSMREANRKWVRPELRAADHLKLTESDCAALRKEGFSAILAAPTGGLLNGSAALVGLSARPPREAVIRADAVACMSVRLPDSAGFADAGSGYPGTLLGAFSHLRQTKEDADWYRRLDEAFKAGAPRRPPADPILKALVVPQRYLVEAETEMEVTRALGFGPDLIICGGNEAWKRASDLKAIGAPVIVSLKLPIEPLLPGEKSPPGQSSLASLGKKGGTADPAADKPREDDPDSDVPPAERVERKRLWNEKLANSIELHKAGVPIAFTTRGCKDPGEFWTNLRRVIKTGLPRDAALMAMTLAPATILGVSRLLGTVEPGKIANLTLMSADFADEKAKAKYVFVDGRKFDCEIEPPGSRTSGAPMQYEVARRTVR